MNLEQEQKLIDLTKRVANLDKQIRKERSEKGSEDLLLREEFNKITEEIKKILYDLGPIDEIRNPQTRDVLKKIRDRNYFLIDIENARLKRLLEEHPEVFKSILKDHGIEIEVTDSEIDEYLNAQHFEFIEEITEKIDSYEYLDRKKKFTTIIVNRKLPEEIHTYFMHVKECFLLGLMLAAVGLSRVLLEVAFKDKYYKFGSSKVINIDKERRMIDIIREVCNKLNLSNMYKEDAKYLYFDISSNILHGKDPKILLNSDEVLDFIKRVFKIIEKLYER